MIQQPVEPVAPNPEPGKKRVPGNAPAGAAILDADRFRVLSMVVEQAVESIVITDPAGSIVYVNPAFEKVTGYTSGEVIGRNPRMLQSGKQSPEFYRTIWDTLTSGKPWFGRFINRRKDGSLWEEESVISPVRDSDGNLIHYVAVKRDMTEERQAEHSRAYYRAIFESSTDAIIAKTLDGIITSWNPGAERIFGYTSGEAVGQPVTMLAPPDRVHEELDIIARIKKGESIERHETVGMRKSGVAIDLSVTVSPIKGSNDDLLGVSKIVADITERKTLEAQLRQSQKMEAIGALAGGIAHDFNNMLTVINGYSDLVIETLKDGDPMRVKIEEIRKAGIRAASLTRQLLVFSRKQILQPTLLDLNSIILEAERMLHRLIGEDIELSTVLGSGLESIRADRGQIEQVIVNLAVNARDAIPNGGELTIKTGIVVLGEEYLRRHIGCEAGSYVMLTVSDTGIGMEPETLARIFEPFFTTKEAGKGTGLGLSTVYGIVRQSGGAISVESEVGHGTTFKIYFPVAGAGVEGFGAVTARAERGSGTILVTEDDDSVRKLTRTILEGCGYQVLEAANAEEAVSIAKRHLTPIHLLLTDVIMPNGNGIDLARRLEQTHPELKVLFMSGYTDNAIVDQGIQAGRMAFIQKPYETSSLAEKVKEVLRSQPASSPDRAPFTGGESV